MTTTNDIEQLNRDLANKLVDEAKRDPKSAYQGRIVGIANGQIVIVADDLGTVIQRLNQIEPDVRRTFCLAVGPDYDKVVEIWEIR
jgi:hypothetical protein